MSGDNYDQQLHDSNKYIKNSMLKTLDKNTYFTLIPQAVKSLDILPKLKPDYTPEQSLLGTGTSRTNTTVYSCLNKCRTVNGQRLLAFWLENPLISKEKIDLRLDIVQHFVENTELRSLCYDDVLKKFPDLLRISYKVNKENCNLADLVKAYHACESIKGLQNRFQQVLQVSNIEAPEAAHKLFGWAQRTCNDMGDFMKLIEDSIDLENIDEAGDYMVKANFDEDVARSSLQLSTICSEARRLLSSVAEDTGLVAGKTVKLETDSEKGFAYKVTRNNEASVRDLNEYQQLNTVKKDGFRFTNRALSKLSSKYVSAKEEYQSLARNIIHDIISKAVMHDVEILELSMVVSTIDVFVGLAVAAFQNNYIRPLILDAESGKIHVEAIRHPCVENQPDVESFVPNDISLSKDDKKFYLITGPNMGGKSTFIKSAAISVVMAQCGSMIPAEDARVSVVDGVYTRIGAGDKQMEGVSTFMEEMLDMATILKSATEKSLVIIDELGRGTSTFDGFGLAWSISKHLATKIKSYTLFATHFHELTELGEELSTVGNLHVKAVCQSDRITFLYSVSEGVCDESYGINVAQYTEFPAHVIEMAKEKLKQFEEVPGFKSKEEVKAFIRECAKEHLAAQQKNCPLL